MSPTILHPDLPYFQPPASPNVMAEAWAILRRKAPDWHHRLIPRDDWMRAALRQAWDKRHQIEQEHDRRMDAYGHLLYMPREAILARRDRLWKDLREMEYYSRIPPAWTSAAAEIDVIETHVLPYIQGA